MQHPSFYHYTRAKPSGSRAFSLLEMSIVILIIGIMVAAILPAITHQSLKDKEEELTHKMDAIEAALAAFRTKNSRLPCPADVTLNNEDVNFGVEADTPGTCTGGTLVAVATSPASNVVHGLVPVRMLGLDESIAYDPWGRAFSYSVDIRLTAQAAYITYAIDDIVVGDINIKARDNVAATVSDLSTKAVAMVMSHGVNGHGAYLPSAARYSSGSTNADELDNCNCDAAAASGTNDAIFVTGLDSSSSATGSVAGFDDILRYYTRGSFMVAGDFARERM